MTVSEDTPLRDFTGGLMLPSIYWSEGVHFPPKGTGVKARTVQCLLLDTLPNSYLRLNVSVNTMFQVEFQHYEIT